MKRCPLTLHIEAAPTTDGWTRQAVMDHEDLNGGKAYFFRDMNLEVDIGNVGYWDLVGYVEYHMGDGEDTTTTHYTAADANFLHGQAWAVPLPSDGSRWMASSLRVAEVPRQRAAVTERAMRMEGPS